MKLLSSLVFGFGLVNAQQDEDSGLIQLARLNDFNVRAESNTSFTGADEWKTPEEWVKQHNAVRLQHVDTEPVRWDAEMAKQALQVAQINAATGEMAHSESYDANPCQGENVIMDVTCHLEPERAVLSWYKEIKNCESLPGCQKGLDGKITGHFTAVVWKGVTRIGCAQVGAHAVCRYATDEAKCDDNTPNMKGRYEWGVQCKKPEFGGCNPTTGSPLAEVAALAYTLTRMEKSDWLFWHNIARVVHVDTEPVRWDDDMADQAGEVALRNAEIGEMRHSDCYTEDPCQGENVFMDTKCNLNPERAVTSWWNEIKNCKSLPGCQKGLDGKKTGHFTAVVWKGVTRIGCAQVGAHAVCRYATDEAKCDDNTPNMKGRYEWGVQCKKPQFGGCKPLSGDFF